MAGRDWPDAVPGPRSRVEGHPGGADPEAEGVELKRTGESALRCPRCGEACPGYDTRHREWRNLDAWGYKTFLVCNVPRVHCPEHGVVTIRVPWAEGSSRYTARFEAEVIGWLKEARVKAVAGRMRLSWNAVDGIMQRAQWRGGLRAASRKRSAPFAGRDLVPPPAPVRDRGVESRWGPCPAHRQGRGGNALMAFLRGQEEYRAAVESLSMDMWGPYIPATRAMIPDAVVKIPFDPVPYGQAPRRRGGQGAAGGGPGAGEGGQTGSWWAPVAVAEGAQAEDVRREAGVREDPCGHPTGGGSSLSATCRVLVHNRYPPATSPPFHSLRTNVSAGSTSIPSGVRRGRGSRQTTTRRPGSCSSARLRNPLR